MTRAAIASTIGTAWNNELQIFENKKGDNFLDVSLEVLEAGLEPARTLLFIGF